MYNFNMHDFSFTLIYFFYGLAFFSMGMLVLIERGRGSDHRLRRALPPLAVFGLLHGGHEWLEMFIGLSTFPMQDSYELLIESGRLAILVFSFLSLAAFGASLLSPTENVHRVTLLVPLAQAAIWGFGLLILRNTIQNIDDLWAVGDVWTRYTVGIPGALLACAGLISQQRSFRKMGMASFGRDSLWAAVAFGWYGVVGQLFTRISVLPPSTYINQALFIEIFGFPVQLLRAASAIFASFYIIRFLKASDVEMQRKIDDLQAARIEDAERREMLRGDLLKRVVAAQEAERQRIARELHDETGQSLTAIGLGLRGIATTIGNDTNNATLNLRKLEEMASRSLDELRRLIADLRPSHLDDLGLAAALRWYSGEIQERTALIFDVDVSSKAINLPTTVNTSLFRIAQEALTNIVKHADAKYVWVRLFHENGSLILEVVDNGTGFDVQRTEEQGATIWGLLGMRERAALLGGIFTLISRPGGGTSVRVTIPSEIEFGDIKENEN